MKSFNYIKAHPAIIISAVVLMVLSYSVYLFASSDGITGKTATSSGGCSCHSANSNNSTSLSVTSGSGSFSVEAGSTTTFTVTVSNSSKQAAGVNIAVKTDQSGTTNAGTLSPETGSGLQSSGGELTHTTPKAMNGGSTSFTFTWTAPTSAGTYYMRAIGNAVDDDGSADADDQWNWMSIQAITVTSPANVTLTAPVGGEIWCPGSSRNITWSQAGVSNVKIELSTNGGSSFTSTLAESVSASTGSWSWSIPANQQSLTTYRVRISDVSNASRKSESASNFTIAVPTSVTSHPANVSSCSGRPVSFTVSGAGTNLTYKWRKNSTVITGATQATYSIPSVTTADAGAYDCLVSGSCGTDIASNTASLTVTQSAEISVQPENKELCSNENAAFTVTATGTDLTYKWRKNGTEIPNASSSSFTVFAVKESDAGEYDVVVNDKCNIPVTSQKAILTVNTKPEITKHPQTVNACLASKSFIFVEAKGSNLSYLWRKNGNIISGNDNDTLFFSNVTASDAANYEVTISGKCQPPVSSSSALLVISQNTAISQEPNSQTVNENSSIDFTVIASGKNLKYQWRKNAVALTGKTTNDLTLTSVVLADSGNYDCIVTGDCGTVTSKAARLTVLKAASGPNLTLLHTSLDFGFVISNEEKDSLFTGLILNTGDKELTITNASITGADASTFALKGISFPLSILPGKSADLSFSFKPSGVGLKTASLQFTSNSLNNPIMSLTGEGVTYEIKASVSTMSFTIKDTLIQAAGSFILKNNSSVRIKASMQISGADASDFSFVSPSEIEIEKGAESEIQLLYKPSGKKSSTAELSISVAGSKDVLRIPLSGSLISSVNDGLTNNDLRIYPNPSNNQVFIEFNNEVKSPLAVYISDINGNLIKDFASNEIKIGENKLQWDLRDLNGRTLPSGSYKLIIRSANQSTVHNLIIMN